MYDIQKVRVVRPDGSHFDREYVYQYPYTYSLRHHTAPNLKDEPSVGLEAEVLYYLFVTMMFGAIGALIGLGIYQGLTG